MSALTYPEYRTSGVEWAQQVPTHWSVVPLFSVLRPSKRLNIGLNESNLLSLSYGRIIRKDMDALDGLLPASFETYQVIEADSLVFRFTDLQNDKRSLRSARATERGIITSAYVAVTPTGIDPRFAEYLMRAYDTCKVFYGYGGGVRQSLTFSEVARMPILLPTTDEQRAIADYLDRETAKVDALVGEQEGLVEVLRERRDAVITRAVTKGLDQSVVLSESGVPSLGAIPSHWRVQRVKHLGRAIIGLTYSPDDIVEPEDGGTLVLRSGNIQKGRISLADNVYVSTRVPTALRLLSDDILICARNGSAKLIGKNAVVGVGLAGQTWGAFMAVLRSPTNSYIRWVLNSQIFTSQIGLFSTSTINQLTSNTLHNLEIAVPPTAEQQQIAAYLDQQTQKIDTLIAEAEGIVILAKERRAALITAAVTGQIDVRGEVA